MNGQGTTGVRPAGRIADWGWNAVDGRGTVLHEWPGPEKTVDRGPLLNVVHPATGRELEQDRALHRQAQAWCDHFNAGGAGRERLLREGQG